jgi:tetratricopeptide (TPR) repeat protein
VKKDLSKKDASNPDERLYFITFALATALRVVFLVYIDDPILFYKYPFFAEKLAAGEDIGERIADLSPRYLYLLVLLKKFFNMDWRVFKIVQSGIGVVNCLLVLRLGTLVFRKEVGFLAALLCAAYGNLIILEATLEPTVFVLLCNLLCVTFLYRSAMDAFSDRSVLLAGAFAGLSIILKPNALLFLAVAVIWFLFLAPMGHTYRKKIRAACMFSIMAMLFVAPITIRNYILLNDFILVTADAGKVFYHGNGKGASALEGICLPDEGFSEEGTDEPDYAHALYRKTARAISGKALSPSEASKFWFRKTIADIRSDIKAYLVRQGKKLFYFFNDYEMHYVASAYKEYTVSLHFPFVRYGILSALGLAGMLLSIKDFKRLFLIYGMLFLYLASGLMLLVQSRYRIPAAPYLCLFAAAAIYKIREWISARQFRSAGAAAILTGLFFVSGNFIYRSEIERVDRWQRATKNLYQMEALPLYQKTAYSDALGKLNQCIALEPKFSPAYNLRGKARAIMGDHGGALSDFEQVIRLSPGIGEGYKNIGFLYLLKGDHTRAKSYLSKAHGMLPGDKKIEKTLNDIP